MDDRMLLRQLFAAALAAVEPAAALRPHLAAIRECCGSGVFTRLVVAGAGKASIPMALAVEKELGEFIAQGLVITPHPPPLSHGLSRIAVAGAGHPHPDEAGATASAGIARLAQESDEHSLFLFLVSGGGSALFVSPAAGITLAEKELTSRLLMESGADIRELNTVRKHLSGLKGGQLAQLVHPAWLVTLAISDVPGDRIDLIASGPTVADPTTFGEALAILEQRGLAARVPPAVLDRLQRGAVGLIGETPKPGNPLFCSGLVAIVAGNRDALEGAAGAAGMQGVQARIREGLVTGEAREAGRILAQGALRARESLRPGERLCIVSGGETTVSVQGNGIGGRNQELALAFCLAIDGVEGISLLSAGTDGIDGPTDAAGGIVDGQTAARARSIGIDPAQALADNDSHRLLDRCDALIRTGPTGTNVMDLQICLVSG